VDPVGSCVGQKGVRVQAVINELGNNEKVDIIQWSDNSKQFIASALAPAKEVEVVLFEDKKIAEVYVPEDQLSLAIGRDGGNVRLAAKLTGWKIDVKKKEVAGNPEDKNETVDTAEMKEESAKTEESSKEPSKKKRTSKKDSSGPGSAPEIQEEDVLHPQPAEEQVDIAGTDTEKA